MQCNNLKQKRKGFTLIELMVATGIMAVLVLIVMTMTGNVLDLWTNASGKLNANAQAREALKYLGDDLESMVVRPNKQAWLEVSYDNSVGPLGEAMPNISIVTATEHRERKSGNTTIYGSISIVNYSIAYQNPLEPDSNSLDKPKIFGLYRMIANPFEVFQSTVLSTNYSEDNPGTGLKALITAAFATKLRPRFETLLSPNIARLRVVFYARYGDDNIIVPLVGDNDRPSSFVYADRIYFTANAPGGKDEEDFRELEYAEIQLTALSDRGAKQLPTTATADMDELIATEGEVYTRRVIFFGK